MKLKLIAAAALTSLACAGSHAADTNWFTHDTFEIKGALMTPGTFSETISFSLASGFTYDVVSYLFGLGVTGGTSYSLFDAADNLVGGAFGANAGPNTVSQLGAGNYYYSLQGATSPFGGAYVLGSAVIATPVPEPQTYALLLAGLGAVGFVAARRRRLD